jgi:hypothetical protein
MVEFTIRPAEPEPKLPRYSDEGRILFEISHVYRSPSDHERYEIEVLDYDSNSSIHWLNEGLGADYWLKEILELDESGFYVVEGVTGCYIRGDGWTTDDDEEWGLRFIRRADPEEIEGQALRPSDKKIRRMAKKLAETINGGVWKDPQFYTEEQRGLWRKHAREILHFLWEA